MNIIDTKLKLKELLLDIPMNHRAFREKYRLAKNLKVELKEIEPLLDELCEKNILLKKVEYICPTCNSTSIMNDELLEEIIVEDNCYECDNCCGLVNPKLNKTGCIYYDIENEELLINW